MTRLEQLAQSILDLEQSDHQANKAYWLLREFLDERNDSMAKELSGDAAVAMQAAARGFDNAQTEGTETDNDYSQAFDSMMGDPLEEMARL